MAIEPDWDDGPERFADIQVEGALISSPTENFSRSPFW
jgi:hypothetical protein